MSTYSDTKFSLHITLYPADGKIMSLPWIDVANKKIWERAAIPPPTDGFYLGDWMAGMDGSTENDRISNMFDNHFDGFCGYFDIFYTTLDDRGAFWDYLESLDVSGYAMVEVEIPLIHVCADEDRGHIFTIGAGITTRMFSAGDLSD